MLPPIFAVFAVCKRNGKFCATTRDDGTIGLPGGKVDSTDADIFAAVERESREEGWKLVATDKIVKIDSLDGGKVVAWILCSAPMQMENFKEKDRGICPVMATAEQLNNPGMKNEFLKFI